VAVVSGRGGSELELAAAAGADLFITGEISEHHPELAAIHRIGLIALGHGLSETGGLVRLGDWLRKMTPLEVGLAPLDNPL
jgi:putative NIF3 family GTP cyclohydrolase 1 type 2